MNRISIQPRKIRLQELERSFIFWIVSIDDIAITSNARPFTAATHEIVLNECEVCSYCGINEVTARKVGKSKVAWFVSLAPGYDSKIPRDKFLVFERSEYEQTLGESANTLDEIGRLDIQHIIRNISKPDWHFSLYTIPDLPSDHMGRTTMRHLMESLSDKQLNFYFDEDLQVHAKLQIGLDLPGIPETLVAFHFRQNEVLFQLQQNPALPCWLSHPICTAELPGLFIDSEITKL